VTIKPQILLSNKHHNGHPIIAVRFKHDRHVINKLKEVIVAVCDSSRKCWRIPQSEFCLKPLSEQNFKNFKKAIR
jgi:hypothetical protein